MIFQEQPATSPDQSEPKIFTDGACADFVLLRASPIRCLFSGVEISVKGTYRATKAVKQYIYYAF